RFITSRNHPGRSKGKPASDISLGETTAWHRLGSARMPRDIIVIGASAGGLQALVTLVERLPHTLPAAVLVAMHTSTTSNGVLPQILARAGTLPVKFAADGETLEPGRIYVARPDY